MIGVTALSGMMPPSLGNTVMMLHSSAMAHPIIMVAGRSTL